MIVMLDELSGTVFTTVALLVVVRLPYLIIFPLVQFGQVSMLFRLVTLKIVTLLGCRFCSYHTITSGTLPSCILVHE